VIRKVILLVVLALAACSAAFAAPPAGGSAHAACVKLQSTMGAQTFAATYASLGACVSKLAALDQGNAAAAKAACTAQQADANFASQHGGKTFDQYYGSGPKGKDAFAHCVSSAVKASETAEQQATPNPAQTCRALRSGMGTTAFNDLYGTNANKSNAFGKCVSKTAHAQTTGLVNAAAQCRTDAAVTSPTADADAFGKCVSAKSKANSAAQQQATLAAAKTCSAERKANSAAFKSTYKTFGRCVSQHAKG
jgi:hypothetical protein